MERFNFPRNGSGHPDDHGEFVRYSDVERVVEELERRAEDAREAVDYFAEHHAFSAEGQAREAMRANERAAQLLRTEPDLQVEGDRE